MSTFTRRRLARFRARGQRRGIRVSTPRSQSLSGNALVRATLSPDSESATESPQQVRSQTESGNEEKGAAASHIESSLDYKLRYRHMKIAKGTLWLAFLLTTSEAIWEFALSEEMRANLRPLFITMIPSPEHVANQEALIALHFFEGAWNLAIAILIGFSLYHLRKPDLSHP
jgi:hypothetical protein